MGKFLSSALVLLASSVALAYPAVGDYAMMSGTASQNGQTAPLILERTIKSFDAATQQFVVSETQTVDGQAETQDTVSAMDEMLSKDQVAQVLQYCPMFGGTLETITVTAGTFATCALPISNDDGGSGTAWVGDVEFGLVKITGTQADGSSYTLSLDKYSAGN